MFGGREVLENDNTLYEMLMQFFNYGLVKFVNAPRESGWVSALGEHLGQVERNYYGYSRRFSEQFPFTIRS